MRIALVTNNPAPYRVPVFNAVARQVNIDLKVFYCARREPDREWNLLYIEHEHAYLRGRVLKWRGRYIHWNVGMGKALKKFSPNVVITCGFNPTMLSAWLYSLQNNVAHVVMSDGTERSEKSLGALHRLLRFIVYKNSKAFLGASQQTLDMLNAQGAESTELFQTHLCVDNGRFFSPKFGERAYDVMFSGRFLPAKMPLFFTDIVRKLAEERGSISAVILGSGPEEGQMRSRLKEVPSLNVDFAGYVTQENLPKYYASAKVFLFPTQSDTWGIVANEACAAGTPVITCENAGVANELVHHRRNGLVLPLDEEKWAEEINSILDNSEYWAELSKNAKKDVSLYNFDAAAKGILDACNYAVS